MNYLDQLQWRYATKQFDSTKIIDSKTWQSIEDSLILTPSSFGLQPWKFVVVTNKEIKEKLREHSWGQPQVTDCSHFVILCATEAITKENQVYIALGQLMATAAALEIDACPMEGISPTEYDKIIEIDGYKTVVACAMGFRHSEDKYAELAKVRFSKDELIINQ